MDVYPTSGKAKMVKGSAKSEGCIDNDEDTQLATAAWGEMEVSGEEEERKVQR